MRFRHLALGLVAVGLGIGAPMAEGQVTVRLAPEAVIQGEELVLGELAAVEGEAELAAAVREVRLGPAPAPGASQPVTLDLVRHGLRRHRIDPGRVRVVVPERVRVTRAAQVVAAESLVEAAAREARAWLARAEPGAGAVALAPVSRPPDLRLAAGRVELDAEVVAEPAPAPFVRAAVRVRVDGREVQRVPLTLRVSRLRSVVVAARALDARVVPGPADLRLEERPAHEVPGDALGALPEGDELELVRPVRPGEALTSRVLQPRVLIRRGERVTLVLEGPGFRITAPGRAAEDGRRGDAVRVVNPGSGRELQGTVEGPGLVRVAF